VDNLSAIHCNWPTLEELQRRYIERVLEHTGHNKTLAASILGIDRRTIQRLASREAETDGKPR
jgi:transcriptional regulator with GAF, ATPase, and Fis domain